MKRLGLVGIASVAVALPFVGGCAVATDLVNPDLLTGLGVDVDTVIPPQGRLIVTFNNQTTLNAEMRVTTSTDSMNPESDNRTEFLQVGAGEVRSSAYSCPIAVIAPGNEIGDGFTTGGVVAVVGFGEDAAEVVYAEDLLISGRDFSCGSVIEIRLIAVAAAGADQEGGFATRVRVIPGR